WLDRQTRSASRRYDCPPHGSWNRTRRSTLIGHGSLARRGERTVDLCRGALLWLRVPQHALLNRRNTTTAKLHPVPGSNWPRPPAPLPRSKAPAPSTNRQPPYAYATLDYSKLHPVAFRRLV